MWPIISAVIKVLKNRKKGGGDTWSPRAEIRLRGGWTPNFNTYVEPKTGCSPCYETRWREMKKKKKSAVLVQIILNPCSSVATQTWTLREPRRCPLNTIPGIREQRHGENLHPISDFLTLFVCFKEEDTYHFTVPQIFKARKQKTNSKRHLRISVTGWQIVKCWFKP